MQFYFYPDGNRYVETDPADDPKAGIARSIPLGYAAAAALGRTHSGPLTTADIDAVCAY